MEWKEFNENIAFDLYKAGTICCFALRTKQDVEYYIGWIAQNGRGELEIGTAQGDTGWSIVDFSYYLEIPKLER